MTADSAPWWFLAIIASVGFAVVLMPSRTEVLRWRHQRSVQGRLEQAALVAGHIAANLMRDPVFIGDVALAIAQALDELDVARVSRPRFTVGEQGPSPWPPRRRRSGTAPDLSGDGYRA